MKLRATAGKRTVTKLVRVKHLRNGYAAGQIVACFKRSALASAIEPGAQ
jgi:hypothetical protein